MKAQICKYCEESFVPIPGKPGLINECPACLHERTRPIVTKDFAERFESRFPERRTHFRKLRKMLVETFGLSEMQAYEFIAAAMRNAGTPV